MASTTHLYLLPFSPMALPTVSQLTSLQRTLNEAIDAFKAELEAQDLPEPSLTTSAPHPTDDITFIPTPAMYEARRVALAAMVNRGMHQCLLPSI
jgi:hypothetical protein